MHVPERVIRPRTTWQASAELPTRHGTFRTHVFLATEPVAGEGGSEEVVSKPSPSASTRNA